MIENTEKHNKQLEKTANMIVRMVDVSDPEYPLISIPQLLLFQINLVLTQMSSKTL